jgi:hypothetical protein
MIERLLQDHARIREVAKALREIFLNPEPGDMGLLAEVRWEMASTLMTHLAFEDRHFYSKLERDPRPHIQAAGRKFRDELTDIFQAYTAHAKEWPPHRICREWETYRMTSLHFIALLLDRADREEDELYSLVETAGIETLSSNAVTTSWAQGAFEIKDRLREGL